MATTATTLYGATNTITLTLAALASSTSAGRASTAVDNTTDIAVDCLVGGVITTTATTTTNTQIQIMLYGSWDGGTTYSAAATGTDGNFTPDPGAKNMMKLLTTIPNITTTAVTYNWGPFSVAQAFGGIMPSKWGVWVLQNTGTAIASSTTKYTIVKYQSA